MIAELSQDTEEEARSGLALGILPHYTDGLDGRVFGWLGVESVDAIRATLLEHMAAKSEQSALYHEVALRHYQTSTDMVLRRRLEAAAQRAPLSLEMRAFSIKEGLKPDLFGTGLSVYIQQGDLVMGGKQSITGGRDVSVGAQNMGSNNRFDNIAATVQQSGLDEEQKKTLLQLLVVLQEHAKSVNVDDVVSQIAETAKVPNKSNIQKLSTALGSLRDAFGAVSSVGSSISEIAKMISGWVG